MKGKSKRPQNQITNSIIQFFFNLIHRLLGATLRRFRAVKIQIRLQQMCGLITFYPIRYGEIFPSKRI